MTIVEIPSGAQMAERWLGGRFRLDERISLDDQVSGFPGPCGSSWEARGLSLWKATDQLLSRPVTIYLLPTGRVPRAVTDAVQAAAKVSDPRLATIYDTDFDEQCPYIVAEWTPGMHLEDLVLSGPFPPALPQPALAAAMIADAADAIAVAHRAGRPHLRLTPRSLRWDNGSGLKITGLGLDDALCGGTAGNPVAADTAALARMLYALLTGYWPGDEPTALPAAPRHHGHVYTPRQVRAGVPGVLDTITCHALQLQATSAVLSPAGLAVALRAVLRPSYSPLPYASSPYSSFGSAEPTGSAAVLAQDTVSRREARHARSRAGVRHRTTLLHPVALVFRCATRGRGASGSCPGRGPAAAWAGAGRCPCRRAARTAG